MIILDNEDNAGQPSTKITSSPQHRADDLEGQPAPLCDEGANPPPPPYSPSAREDQPLLPSRKPARRARYRFASAFAVAVVIFVASGICFNGMLSHLDHFHRKIPRRRPVPKQPPVNPGFSDKIIQCIDLNEWAPDSDSDSPIASAPPRQRRPLQMATAAFHLPSAAESLFFVSDGSVLGQIIVMADSDDVDEVHVEVLRRSRVKELPKTNICVLEREKGNIGVGVLTSEHASDRPNDQVAYIFTLKLPASKKHPRFYKSYDVSAPFMMNVFDNLDGIVNFDSVSVYSPNSIALVESLYADRINITTTEGGIQGVFRASSLLSLSSSEELMFVNIDLHGGDPENPTQLILTNPNGSTQANVRLSPHKSCNTIPHSGHTLHTSIPSPLPPFTPPTGPQNSSLMPTMRPTAQIKPSSTAPELGPSASPTSCPPPSFSIHAFADTALTLNLLSPRPPPPSPPDFDPNTTQDRNSNAVTPLLILSAITSAGSATLTLPATYEGQYDVEGRFAIIIDDVPEDPLGRGRRRRFRKVGGSEYGESQENMESEGTGGGDTGTPNRAVGKVWWGDSPSEVAERSRVSVRATKMAYLHFGE